MASPWLFCKPQSDGRQGTTLTNDGTFGGHREYTVPYLVKTADRSMGSLTVCLCPLLPGDFSPYVAGSGVGWTEFDPNALLVDKKAIIHNKDDGGNWWIVNCLYSTMLPIGGPPDDYGSPSKSDSGSANNPEMEPAQLEWDFETVHKALDYDLDKKPFVNSAWQPYKPAPLFEHAHAILTISRNELGFDRVKATNYAYSVNDKKFLGADPETVQCLPPKATLVYRGAIRYMRVTYKLRFCHTLLDDTLETWQPRFLDVGLGEIQNVPNKPHFGLAVPVIRKGHAMQQEILLDGKGRPLQPAFFQGGLPQFVPVYNKYNVYKKRDFTTLLVKGLV